MDNKIKGWLSKDPGDYYVHFSFGSKPEFDGDYWNDMNGCGMMYALPEEMFPEVSTKEPMEVELTIKPIKQ